jgi:geranylgeranyl diphosphate synthase, type I
LIIDISTYFEQKLPWIEADLQGFIDKALEGINHKELRSMLNYHMGWEGSGAGKSAQGKRIRPVIAMLSGENCGVESTKMLPFCTAIELLHNFSLIHDDIEDYDEKRRGRETVWKKWGIPQAINCGDLLFSLASHSMIRATASFSESIVLHGQNLFFETCKALTIGQHMDMNFEKLDYVSADQYIQMIHGKTAALLGFSTAIGAIAGGMDEQVTHLYQEFGINLGIAFQIQDDYLGIWGNIDKTGKAKRSDLISRKKTFPIICGLENKNEFHHLWHHEDQISTDTAENLAHLLEAEGIDKMVISEVKRYTDSAMENLERITDSNIPAGKLIKGLSMMLMNRNY